MGRVKAQQDVDFLEGLRYIGEKLDVQANEPNIYRYVPHPKQELFHRNTSHTRLYIGGNRSGKTLGGTVEAYWRSTQSHPYTNWDKKRTRGRIVCVDINKGINQIIIPKLQQIIPASQLKGGSWDSAYHTDLKVLTFKNGSTIELMTYEQKLDSFAGTSRDWVWFDEEPPKDIYNECMARLVDTNGFCWLTLTPVSGMTWIYEDIYAPVAEQDRGNELSTSVIEVDMQDNPYLEKGAVERFLNSLDADERKAREHGKFIQVGGAVYKQFNEKTHVVPWEPSLLPHIRSCEIYTSMDHGYNAPSAWLWHAVGKDGSVLTFGEHYKAEMTVSEHATAVKAFEQQMGIEVRGRIADPATQQRQGVTGVDIITEYAIHGVYLIPGNNDVASGVLRVQKYLRGENPKWHVTNNCVNLIREMPRLRWATYASKQSRFNYNPQEKIHKKDDHACDSLRYFLVTAMPDIIEDEPVIVNSLPTGGGERYDEVISRMVSSGAHFNAPRETPWQFGSGDSANLEWD